MSRTKHHRHQRRTHCGTDLWSRRGDMGSGSPYNWFSKFLTRRKERAAKKRDINKEMKQDE